MDLKTWLEPRGSGKALALAEHIGVSVSAVSQWKTNGVPLAHMKAVRDFTGGEVSLEEMVPDPAVELSPAAVKVIETLRRDGPSALDPETIIAPARDDKPRAPNHGERSK
jgi:DNA-binding transcriptional regulator YdaS (Cro superfamily)